MIALVRYVCRIEDCALNTHSRQPTPHNPSSCENNKIFISICCRFGGVVAIIFLSTLHLYGEFPMPFQVLFKHKFSNNDGIECGTVLGGGVGDTDTSRAKWEIRMLWFFHYILREANMRLVPDGPWISLSFETTKWETQVLFSSHEQYNYLGSCRLSGVCNESEWLSQSSIAWQSISTVLEFIINNNVPEMHSYAIPRLNLIQSNAVYHNLYFISGHRQLNVHNSINILREKW